MVVERIKFSARVATVLALGCVGANSAASAHPPSAAFPPAPVSAASTKALQVVGNYLFVAAWGRGLQVLDISNPAQPRWAGAWNPRRCVTGVHIVGNRAYLANRLAGFNILDVTNPQAPVQLGALNFKGDAHVVYVAGDRAYVGEHPRGFRVIDIKDPAHPMLLATVTVPQSPMSIEVAGDYACVALLDRLQVYDIRDARAPALVSTRRIRGPVSRVQIVGKVAHIATGQTSLLNLDLTDPAFPQPVDSLMFETNNLPIVFNTTNGGFQWFGDTSWLTNSALRAMLQSKHPGEGELEIPAIVGRLRDSGMYGDTLTRLSKLPRHFHGLHVLDGYALALSTGFEVVDPTDIARPRRLGGCALKDPTWDVRGAGRYAYVMDNGANIHVVNLGGLTNPVVVSRFDSRGYVSSILTVPEIGKPVTATPPERYANAPTVTGPPELTEPARLPDGGFAFTLVGVSNASYIVHASPDLVSWTPISTNSLPATGQLRITDPGAASNAHRYYRAVKE